MYLVAKLHGCYPNFFPAPARRRFKSLVTFLLRCNKHKKLFAYIFKLSALRLQHLSVAYIFETWVFCLKMSSTYGRKQKAAALAACPRRNLEKVTVQDSSVRLRIEISKMRRRKLYVPTLTPAGWKLRSHAGSRLRSNFSRLIEKRELLLSCLIQFPKYVNSDPCKERKPCVKWINDNTFLAISDFLSEKHWERARVCMRPKTSDFFGRLRNSLGISGNDQAVFKNPSTPRIKISRLYLRKSWQVYTNWN